MSAAAIAAATATVGQAAAQPPPAPTEAAPAQESQLELAAAKEGVRPDGWSPGVAFGGTFNLSDNRKVIGQPDGSSLTVGGSLDGALEYNRGPHEWRNTLALGLGGTRTPGIEQFVKTRDALGAETIYLYHVIPIFGPFARAALATPVFAGNDARAAATTYSIAHLDGTTETLGGRRLRLTDPFEPLTLKQSLGVFVQPLSSERIRLEARAGAGAQEVFAEEALAIQDDEATAAITEVVELDSFQQLGAEGVVNAWGTFDDAKRIAYGVGVSVMVPFVYSELPPGDDRGSLELTNVEVTASLSVRIVDWASLDYKLAIIRQPQLIDDTQITNNLLVTFGWAFGSKAPAPPEPPPCKPEELPAPATNTPPAAAEPAAPAPPPAAAPPAAAPPPAAPPPPTPEPPQ